ncbi:methyltransferase family protein [Anseongella ginsenosidimutans]|uniref:Methyltransferase family protein n=1 Tax=Anseongella ginsenosidimutans TaxID=496056 RepID=A0A4R3KRE2_9SPHI|nr:methyltransferase domain-containing protein [Anseongella ginsenosidimutans]QEC52856.1 methyltransferase domain-containing protein [Anseongella ginsenosidimutans]TCS87244.1 methyltransferase family protein [Anseongella ginsenosidimutans]
MNRFARRSCLSELIDAPGIPFAEWSACLKELDFINTWLGGHRITVEGFKKLLPADNGRLSVAEIGCGGGDNLKAIHAWNRKRKKPLNIHYTGIDLNKACIDFARENCRELPSANFVHADYRTVCFGNRPDIIFSSLFCHHLSDPELKQLFDWLKENAGGGFFMNDLHRSPLAYHSIRALTRLFSRSYLVKNDAPVSVLRGFKRKEWQDLLAEAGIGSYAINWRWAFRYLVSVRYE